MGNSYGYESLGTFGRSIQLSADGSPKFKSGGVTVDWTTIAAISGAPVVYEDGVTLAIGDKGLRYGQVMYRTADGHFAPADNTTTLVRGETFLLNETVLESDLHSNHPGVIEGGRVFRDRILAGAAGQPTLAAVQTAMPLLSFAYN